MRYVVMPVLTMLVGYADVAAQTRCSDRRGVHRWSIKTSVSRGALSREPMEIDLADFLAFESLPVARNDYLDALIADTVPGWQLRERDIVETHGWLHLATPLHA